MTEFRVIIGGMANQKSRISPSEMVRLYREQRLNSTQIGEIAGICRNGVLHHLKLAGVERRSRISKVSTQEIADMYFGRGMSVTEIGALTCMTPQNVMKRLRRGGYALRHAGRGRFIDPRFAPTEHPTIKDIAWAAGIYEGEGSCLISKAYGGATITVGQREPWLVYRLRALFGGSVTTIRRHITNRTEFCTYYAWRVAGVRGRGFMMTVFPFLSPHRQSKIKAALSVYREKRDIARAKEA